MNKKGDFQVSPIIKAIIVLLVVVVIISFWNSTAFAGIKAFLGFNIPGQNQNIEPLTNYDFYNGFVDQYQACKLSPFTECRCKITSLENRLPTGYAIELAESGGDIEISLAKFSLNKECQFISKERDDAAESATIKDTKLFTMQATQFTEKNKISILGVYKAGDCSLDGTLIKDYSAGDPNKVFFALTFSNNIYKKSPTEMWLLSNTQLDYIKPSWDDLEECTAPEDAVEANEKFEAFIKEINDLNTGAESTKTVKLELPADYTLKQEGSELLLNYAHYSKQEIKKSATSLCPAYNDLPNGNYALTRTRLDPGITCIMIQPPNP